MVTRFLKSIKGKLIGITITFTLLITIVITTLVYNIYNSLLSERLIQSTTYNLSLAASSISKNILPIISLSRWCETNIEMARFIEAANAFDEVTKYHRENPTQSTQSVYDQARNTLRQQSLASWKRLQEEFRNNRSSLYINRIIVSNNHGKYLQISPISSYHAFNVFDMITSLESYHTQLSTPGIYWTGLETDPFSEQSGALMLPLIHPVYAPYDNRVIGFSYLSINSQLISDAFSTYEVEADSALFVTIHNQTYEVHPQGIALADTSIALDFSEHVQKITNPSGHTYQMIHHKSDLDGWYFSQILSTQALSTQRHVYVFMILMIAWIVMVLGVLLTFILTRQINKPIRHLLKTLKRIANGDFSNQSDIEWDNEFGEIGRGINHLSENVLLLMDKRVEDEKEKNQLAYEILQSQINPHFLYNTLNSIKWMATIQNANGIADMTTALAKLLRSVSKDTTPIHPLDQELALLNHYVLIQKYRYGGMLNLQIDIATHLLDLSIPKFTLQPIVENAIFHGIEPKQATGHIHIYALDHGSGDFQLCIEDDGIGMTAQQIQDLLSDQGSHQTDFFKKIGINNVHQRIRHAFGTEYGLTIQSVLGKGTQITISLPKRSTL